MGAAHRIADGGGNAHGFRAVTFHECPTQRATGSSGFRRRLPSPPTRYSPNTGRSPAGPAIPVAGRAAGEPPTLAKKHCARPVLSAARWAESRLAGNSPDQEWGADGRAGGSQTLRQCRCRCERDPQYCLIVYVCRRSERSDSRAADAGSRNPRRADLAVAVYSPVGGICGIRTVSTAIGWATS